MTVALILVSGLPLSPGVGAQQPVTVPRVVVRAFAQGGPVIQQSSFLRGGTESASGSTQGITGHLGARFEIGRRADGSARWHSTYGFPSWGLGLFGAGYGNDRELGRPTAVYGWFSWPFHQTEHIRFASEWGLGVAGGWEAFDPETNPRQTSLGLPVSALLEAGVSAAVGITEQWDLMGAAGFTHFSNGALREPNVGLNHLGIRLGVAGRFGESRSDEGEPEPLDPSLRGAATALTADGDGGNWDYSFRLASGARSIRFDRTDSVQTSRYFGEVYPVVSLTSITGRSLGAKARLMVGLDVTYDRSSDERHLIARVADGGDVVGESLSWSARSSVSILGGYTQVMGRASVGARLGVTALRGSGPGADPRFFQELALGWGISRSLTLGVDTRFVEFSRSIFMDWGITYRFGGA